MTDHLPEPATPVRSRELLSALMDGEASEHELRQALRALQADGELTASWRRYHLARAALRGDGGSHARIDLTAAINARIDGEPAAARAPQAAARRVRAWLAPLASVAVAATVAVVTVLGWQVLQPGVPAGVDGAPVPVAAVDGTPAGAQTVALGPQIVVRPDGEELVLPEEPAGSPTAAQDRLNAFLARHAQSSSLGSARGLSPYARVVSLEGEQGR